MSNNLERHLAVVTLSSDSKLAATVGEFDFLAQFFAPEKVSEIFASEFDAILFDDFAIPLERKIERTLREFHSEFKPIGVIGAGSQLVLNVFGYELELAMDKNIASNDFLSDRDFKVLSTDGADEVGIRRMLRELWEMA